MVSSQTILLCTWITALVISIALSVYLFATRDSAKSMGPDSAQVIGMIIAAVVGAVSVIYFVLWMIGRSHDMKQLNA